MFFNKEGGNGGAKSSHKKEGRNNFNGHIFSSQEKLKTYILSIFDRIYDLKGGNVMEGDEDYDLIRKLLERHPHYEEKYKTRKMTYYKLTLGFGSSLKRVYNLSTDEEKTISWVSCITRREMENDGLKSSMRDIIQNDIDEYRRHNGGINYVCVKCGSTKSESIQVDHITPFATLYTDFMKQNTYEIPSEFVQNKQRFNRTMFAQTDSDFVKSWCDYHKNHATFQLLCNQCNGRKSNKNIRGLWGSGVPPKIVKQLKPNIEECLL